jgi:hypothetical protein
MVYVMILPDDVYIKLMADHEEKRDLQEVHADYVFPADRITITI